MINKAQSIGIQIKIAREEAGMSQMELAKVLGFESATAISLVEAGERKITADNLEKIAEALHRDIYFFLGRDSKYTPDVKVALRADKNISETAKKTILNILEMDKKKE
ncbi:MAG: helix-turn-helix transcriptional regulator [Candidatus Pacebacteria bacterium]|nr:helix-turn-helix transcriptional regulator [Candidatus Paceibacterota bacterium]